MRRFFVTTLAVLLALPVFAQPAIQAPPVSPQRDAQALLILRKAIAASGGIAAVQAINDFEAEGQIKYPGIHGEPSGHVKVQGRGIDQVRMDVQVPEGTRSLILNHGAGSFKDIGSTAKVPMLNGFHIGLLVFPLPAAIAAIADAQADVILESTVQVNGNSIYRIKIARSAPTGLVDSAKIRNLRSSEIFIDSTSFMIVGISHPYFTGASSAQVLTREVVFGNFQQINGVSFPSFVSEKMGGQPSWEITFNFIKFNLGLTDSPFQQ